MAQQFEHLFKPIQIGSLTLPNRICFSGHTMMYAKENVPGEREAYYYGERAKGGAGLIVIGGVFAHPTSNFHPGVIRGDDELSLPGLKLIANMVHEHGAKVISQAWHAGREMGTSLRIRQPIWAPSPIPDHAGMECPKEMEIEDIEEVIAAKARAARIAREAGVDGIELLATQGTLMAQFLNPTKNRRTDEYGGSLENRLRYPLRVFESIRKEIGKDFVVGWKLAGDEFEPGGLTLQDAQEIAKRVAATGLIDYIHVCSSTFWSVATIVPEMSFPPGSFAYLAAGIREVVNIPVLAVKRINDPVLAEKILADGQADLVAMARALIADPELPKKAREGRLEDIRQCTGSNQECIGRFWLGLPIGCVQNPAAGEEKRWGVGTLIPAKRKKKVVVVGGGPGGMKVAEIAALRGHEVTLYEKAEALGGQVLLITQVKSRGDWGNVVRYLTIQLRKLGVKIFLEQEMTAERVLAEGADAVVIATGSHPLKTGYTSFRPDVFTLPGVGQDNVFTVWDAFNGAHIGQRVLLIDDNGDFEATITAEHLADRGKQVHIVTRLPFVGMKIEAASIDPQMERLAERKVGCTCLMAVTEIRGNTVMAQQVYTKEEQRFEADSIVLVMGKHPNQELYKNLKGKVKELYRIGDCVAPRKITDAIYEGNIVGREL